MEHRDLTHGKTELSPAKPFAAGDEETVPVIVKVKVPNYVPAGFKVRARIDEQLFTADCRGADLRTAQEDPKVESLSLSKQLRLEG
jgi:hypothetical protein